MSFDPEGMAAKVAVETLTRIMVKCFEGLPAVNKWIETKRGKKDFINKAAKRYGLELLKKYNTIKIIGMNEPISLEGIYIGVNFLAKVSSQFRVTPEELDKLTDKDRRSFGKILRGKHSGIRAIEKYNDLYVLGKPGSGKTTFLKHIAIQSILGNLKGVAKGRIPVFLGLRDLLESDTTIQDFILKQFDICNFPEECQSEFISQMLKEGNMLLLFDGLDEIGNKDINAFIKQLCDFVDKYNKNQFIISCRVAAYNYVFEHFTDVEIADLDDRQIKDFINKWFTNDSSKKANKCFQKLMDNPPIKELATTPLLLALLCITFDEIMDFPSNRTELYKESVDALLKKWDSSRGIQRDEIYRYLSTARKENMFCEIAWSSFVNDEYFLKQDKLEKLIADFIRNLPGAKQETLVPDSEVVLKSIEAQHGIIIERARSIYSFSHLTFQEYYVAKYLIDNRDISYLSTLIDQYLTKYQWREVFLLISGMLSKADDYLLRMKIKVNELLTDERLINIIKKIQNWINIQHNIPYNPWVSRCLMIGVIIGLIYDYSNRISSTSNQLENHVLKMEYSGACISVLETAHNMLSKLDRDCAINYPINEEYDLAYDFATEYGFNSKFDHDFIYNFTHETDLMISFLTYMKANELLVECISSDCYISKETREKILNELFMVKM